MMMVNNGFGGYSVFDVMSWRSCMLQSGVGMCNIYASSSHLLRCGYAYGAMAE